MASNTFRLFFSIFYIIIFSLPATADEFNFKRYDVNNGLSNNTVSCITQDAFGFIWIGTENGLNRFNGNGFTNYRHSSNNKTSISSNTIFSMCVDRTGNLWIVTDKGLSRYNWETDGFENFNIHNKGVLQVFSSSSNQLWLGCEDGLWLYNFEKKELTPFEFDNHLTEGRAVTAIIEDKLRNIWIGVWGNGIYKINPITGKVIHVVPDKANVFDIKDLMTYSLYLDTRNRLWVGPHNYGYFYIDLNTFECHFLTNNFQEGFNCINCIEDDKCNLWFGSSRGLLIYDKNIGKVRSIECDKYNPNSISGNNISRMFRDNQNGLWVGTKDAGVNVYNAMNYIFSDKLPIVNQSKNSNTRSFKSALKDRNGNLWIGSDAGLSKIDKKNHIKLFVHDANNPGSLNVGGVTALCEDKKGRIWVGNWGGGFHQILPESGKIIKYISNRNLNPNAFGDANVFSIVEDKNGFLWIGLLNSVIDQFNPETKKIKHINLQQYNLDFTKSLAYDSVSHTIWGSSRNGLFSVNCNTYEISVYKHLKNNSISDNHTTGVRISHDGKKVWVTTVNGLDMLDEKSGLFCHYGLENGLIDENLYSIELDKVGNVWVGHEKGISCFYPDEKRFVNYSSADDGVICDDSYSYFSHDGLLFMGGVNGVNVFRPEEIKRNLKCPDMQLYNVKMWQAYGDSENVTSEHSVLNNSTIQIPVNVFQFNLEFAALNYIKSNKNQYAYQLEGLNENWISLNNVNNVTFVGLQAGKYKFNLKASNNDGIWNDNIKSITIEVLPPFWKRIWFKVIFVLFFIIGTVIFLYLKTKSIRLQQVRLESQVKKRTLQLIQKQEEIIRQNVLLEAKSKEISDMAYILHENDQNKLQFFTNISHEFRTPLTLIISPLYDLISNHSDSNSEWVTNLNMAHKNAEKLLMLINQFIDIRKLDLGVLNLQVSETSVYEFISQALSPFNEYATSRNITLRTNLSEQMPCVWLDFDKLDKIISNILSNAFKFSPVQSEIEVNASIVHQIPSLADYDYSFNYVVPINSPLYLEFSISDEGIGIEKKDAAKIFERFYNNNENSVSTISGTGIGLYFVKQLVALHRGALSVSRNSPDGAVFTIWLPCSKQQFAIEELCDIRDNELKNSDFHAYKIDLVDNISFSSMSDVMENNDQRPLLHIIEDHYELAKYLHESFSGMYNVVTSTNGLLGFERALEQIPDLIISDIMMPGIIGTELIQRLRNDDKTSHIPIFLLTAKAETESQLTGLSYGADDYITKPFHVTILKQKVKNLIENRRKLVEKFKLTIETATNPMPDASSIDVKFMKKLSLIVEGNIASSSFGVEKLSESIGMSRSQAYRKIKALTGMSPQDYLTDMRMKLSVNLLKQGYRSSEISFLVGFETHSAFSQVFKTYFGITPSEYKHKI